MGVFPVDVHVCLCICLSICDEHQVKVLSLGDSANTSSRKQEFSGQWKRQLQVMMRLPSSWLEF